MYLWGESNWDEVCMKNYIFFTWICNLWWGHHNTNQVTSLVTEMQSPVEWKVVTN